MTLDDMKFDFEPEDQLPPSEYERRRIPPETKAQIRVRPDKDGNMGDFKNGESQYGPWMAIPFEVVDGEYSGEWVSMMLNLNPQDRRFRKVFEVVTGMDISQGGSKSFEEFKEDLIAGVFAAEIGPEVRKNADGVPEETGYTKVFRLEERVGERSVSAGADSSAPSLEDELDDEDTPF